MKVSEIAYLAGTTVRTVRWYHSVGLLPVPAGQPRNYDFDHLARLVRIRWLAESGMNLKAIGQILDDSNAGATEDFDSALERIDAEIHKLTAQRERIAGLRELVEAGEDLSPIPPSLECLYATVRARLTDPRHIELFDRDRIIVSIIGAWSELPDVTEYSTTEADIAAMIEALEIFAQAVDANDVSPLVDKFIVVYLKLASKFGLVGLADNIVHMGADFNRLLLAIRIAYPDRKHRRFIELCFERLGLIQPGAFETSLEAGAARTTTKEEDTKVTEHDAEEPGGIVKHTKRPGRPTSTT